MIFYLMILYNRSSIFISISLIHSNNPDMFLEKNESSATVAIYGNVNLFTTMRYIRFIHHTLHRLQLNGFGITALIFNHLDSITSSDCIKPLRSMTKHTMISMSNMFNIVFIVVLLLYLLFF